MPEEVVQALIEVRQRHPSWGAKKLLAFLSGRHPDRAWPARSTVCDILDRHGLVRKPRARRRVGHPGKPSTAMSAPNRVWCADFKGQFKTRDGLYCYPLTVTDGYSRYLLACQALSSTAVAEAQPVFARLFREFGLPERIRTDNGVPFATTTLARLSSLSAFWVRLGILPEFILYLPKALHPCKSGSSSPVSRSKMGDTSACTGLSRPRPRAHRRATAPPSKGASTASVRNSTTNAPTRRSG